HLTPMPGVELTEEGELLLAAQAQLPLLNLGDLDWYQGFHEIVLYPDDFVSPQRHRDSSGVEHVWEGHHSGEAWQHGAVILAWPG
ncbi:zinc-dependent peptidase, partial [Pseudomonas sp. FSL R10-0071]